MNIDSRLYRRPASRPVGTPVPPNAADIAAGLVVEWEDDPATYTSRARVNGYGLLADREGRFEVHNRGREAPSVLDAYATCPRGIDSAKRAAVLALATHLVAERARAVRPWSSEDAPTYIDRVANPPSSPIESVPVFKVPSPSPWVPKVGDRVRAARNSPEGAGRVRKGDVFTITFVDGQGVDDADYMWFIWEKLEPIPAEKPGLPSFESLVWGPKWGLEETTMPDGAELSVSLSSWGLIREGHATIHGHGDAIYLKRTAYDAWVALQK